MSILKETAITLFLITGGEDSAVKSPALELANEEAQRLAIEAREEQLKNVLADKNKKLEELEDKVKALEAFEAEHERELERKRKAEEERKKKAEEEKRKQEEAKRKEAEKAKTRASKSSNVNKDVSKAQGQTFNATYYSAFCPTCGEWGGITATGDDISKSIYVRGKRVVAVDPNVIPLGSLVEVSTPRETFQALALDTGGAIKGNRIDILVGSTEEAYSLGRHNVKVRVIK